MAFDTSLRDQAIVRKREEREALRRAVFAEVMSAFTDIAPTFGISELYLFGSITRPGSFRDESDVDVAVDQPKVDTFGLAVELSRRLRREVHVVDLESGRIRDVVNREGVRWIRAS